MNAKLWLGAPAPGGLALPAANPTPAQFYGPRGVFFNDDLLYVADAGNHRVVGWRPHPASDLPADFVLRQPRFDSAVEFPYAKQSAEKLRFPYDMACNEHVLAVSDTANNRILFWTSPPSQPLSAAAHAVLGQPDFALNGENNWKEVNSRSLYWPYGICLHQSTLAVADSGNNRVMLWDVNELLTSRGRTSTSEQRSLICA